MKIKLRQFFLLLFLGLNVLNIKVFAQNDFKSEDDLKKQADKLFEEQKYQEALPLFSQLLSLYQKDPVYNYKYGTCMLYATEDKEKPLMYLGFASNKPNVDNDVFFQYGRALQLNYRFEEAINIYNNFKKNASSKSISSSRVDDYIENCNNGRELLSSITKLNVLDKKDLKEADFYVSYDLGDLGGKLVVKPEDFLTAVDVKKKDKSLMFIMPGAKEYFFSSFGESEKNSRDIYKVVKLPSGEFSKPINLGSIINTNKDEEYPFMHPNGKTLYFCSKGHNSMGGYDIFRSEWDASTSTWSKPVNLDFAINSPDDDIMYITNKESSLAYFASKRSNILGRTHIYKIKQEEVKEDILLVSGKVVLPAGSDLSASIQVKDVNNKGKIIGTYRSNPKTGAYLINVPNGGNVELIIDVPKYSTLTRQFEVPKFDDFSKTLKQEIAQNENDATSLVLNNKFNESTTEDDKNAALAFIKQSANLDINYDPAIEAINNKEDSASNGQTEPLAENTTPDKSELNENPENEEKTVDAKAENKPIESSKNNKGGMSENELVNIAYDDAKQSQQEAKDIKTEAIQARQVVDKKKQNLEEAKEMLSIAKTNEAAETDPAKKQAAQNLLSDLQSKVNSLETQVQLTETFANKLEQNAAKKQAEAEAELKYANDLETAVKSNSDKGAIARLTEQRKEIEQAHTDYSAEGQFEEIKDAVTSKQLEINTNQDKITTLNKDIQELEAEKNQLIQEQGKTKDNSVKQTLSNQIQEIESEQKSKRDNLLLAENKSKLLKIQYDSLNKQVDIVNNLVAEIKSATPDSLEINAQKDSAEKEDMAVENIKNSEPEVTVKTNNFSSIPLSTNASNGVIDAINQKAYLKEIDQNLNQNKAKSDPLAVAESNNKTYTDLLSALETDINITKQQIESSEDEDEKQKLNAVIAELENIKLNAKTELDKNNQVLALNKPESENTATDNLKQSPTVVYNNEYKEELNKADAVTDDKEREELKKKINETWLAKINTETEDIKNKMTTATEEEKPILQEKLKDLAIAANERKVAIKNNEEKINQLTPVANTNSADVLNNQNSISKDTLVNEPISKNNSAEANIEESDNAINTNNQNVNNNKVDSAPVNQTENVFTSVNKAVGVFPPNSVYNGVIYTSQSASQSLMLYGPGQKKSDNLRKELDSLKIVSSSTSDEEDKQALDELIEDKQQKLNDVNVILAEVVGEANKRQYSDQKEALINLKNKNVNNSSEQVVMANALSNEAENLFKEAQTVREQVKLIENYQDKEAALAKAYDLEKQSFQKQQKSYELFNQVSEEVLAADNSNKTSEQKTENERVALNDSVSNVNQNNPLTNKQTTATVSTNDTLTANIKTDNLNTEVTSSENKGPKVESNARLDSIKSTPLYDKYSIIIKDKLAYKDSAEVTKSDYNASINQFNAQFKNYNQLKNKLDTVTKESDKKILAEQLVIEEAKTDSLKSIMQSKRQVYDKRKLQLMEANAEIDSLMVNLSEEERNDLTMAYNGTSVSPNTSIDEDIGVESKIQRTEPENKTETESTPDVQNIGPVASKENEKTPEVQNIGPASNNKLASNEVVAKTPNTNNSKSNPVVNNPSKPAPVMPAKAVSNATKVEIKDNKIILPKTFDEINMFFEKAENSVYSSNNPIPIDVNIPEGLIFKVQIGAFRNPIPQDLFKGFNPVTGERTQTGVIRYSAGFFKKFLIADQAKREIQSMGYRDAFVVAFYNGKRISINEAIAMDKNGSLASNVTAPLNEKSSTVSSNANVNQPDNIQVSENGQPVNTINDATVAVDNKTGSKDLNSTKGLIYTVQIGVYRNPVTAAKLYNVTPIYSEVLSTGLIRYTSGLFKQDGEASLAKNKIVAKGIKDAFVIAYNNGKKISLAEARALSTNSSTEDTQGTQKTLTPSTQPVAPANKQNIVPEVKPAVSEVIQKPANADTELSNVPASNQQPDNNKINESDAVLKFNTTSDTGIVYKVQIGVFRNEVPNDIAVLFLRVSSKGVDHYLDEDSLTYYTLGKVRTYAEADELKQYAIQEGISKPFVVAYKNGKKIDIEEARSITEKP